MVLIKRQGYLCVCGKGGSVRVLMVPDHVARRLLLLHGDHVHVRVSSSGQEETGSVQTDQRRATDFRRFMGPRRT